VRLKRVAFLAATNKVSLQWRMTQLKKCIKKMPRLSPEFYNALGKLEDARPLNFQQSLFEFITIKRHNVGSLINFIKNISTDKDIETLKSLLIDAKEPSSLFKLKRKNR
jgi:hypothetical protein